MRRLGINDKQPDMRTLFRSGNRSTAILPHNDIPPVVVVDLTRCEVFPLIAALVEDELGGIGDIVPGEGLGMGVLIAESFGVRLGTCFNC